MLIPYKARFINFVEIHVTGCTWGSCMDDLSNTVKLWTTKTVWPYFRCCNLFWSGKEMAMFWADCDQKWAWLASNSSFNKKLSMSYKLQSTCKYDCVHKNVLYCLQEKPVYHLTRGTTRDLLHITKRHWEQIQIVQVSDCLIQYK